MTAITILMAAHSKAKNWDPARMGKISVEVLLALGLACSVSPRSGKEEPRLAAIELFPGEELVCARLDRENARKAGNGHVSADGEEPRTGNSCAKRNWSKSCFSTFECSSCE